MRREKLFPRLDDLPALDLPRFMGSMRGKKAVEAPHELGKHSTPNAHGV
jgi:hypothetical protein